MGKERGQKRRHAALKKKKKKERIPLRFFAQDFDIAVEDGISRLPDEILFSILSLLPLTEAARTIILCKRWKYFWLRFSNLFHGFNNLTWNVIDNCSHAAIQHPKRRRFVRWVNHVLFKHNTCEKIPSCKIAYPLGFKYHRSIHKWILYLARKGVEELDIDLSMPESCEGFHSQYIFPHWLFDLHSSRCHPLKRLSLASCILILPPVHYKSFNSICFSNLVFLTIKNTNMRRDGALENIFSSCLSLQHFSMSNCLFRPLIKIAPNPQQSRCLKLKYLSMVHCYCLTAVEIHNAVDLVSLEYGDSLSHISLIDSAQPRKLSLYSSTWETSSVLQYAFGGLVDFPRVERLQFRFPRVGDNMVPKQLPNFSMLTELDLIFLRASRNGLLQITTSLLMVSPFLSRLLVNLPCQIDEEPVTENITASQEKNDSFRHKRLKDVEIICYRGYDIHDDLVLHMLRVAVNVHKLRIVCQEVVYLGDDKWQNYGTPSWVETEGVRRLFAGKVSDDTELVVV